MEANEYLRVADAIENHASRLDIELERHYAVTTQFEFPPKAVLLSVWDAIFGPTRLFTCNVREIEERITSKLSHRQSSSESSSLIKKTSSAEDLSDIDGNFTTAKHLQHIVTEEIEVAPCPFCRRIECVCDLVDDETEDDLYKLLSESVAEIMGIDQRPFDEMTESKTLTTSTLTTMTTSGVGSSSNDENATIGVPTDTEITAPTQITIINQPNCEEQQTSTRQQYHQSFDGGSSVCSEVSKQLSVIDDENKLFVKNDCLPSSSDNHADSALQSGLSVEYVDDFATQQALSDELYGNGGYMRHSTSTTLAPGQIEFKSVNCVQKSLLLLCYSFAATRRKEFTDDVSCSKCRYSIILLFESASQEWTLHRRRWLSTYIENEFVPHLRVSLEAEQLEETLCRFVTITRQLLSTLHGFHLYTMANAEPIADTLLAQHEPQQDLALGSAIQAHLSHYSTVVVGDDGKKVAKMMNTLYYFSSPIERWSTLSIMSRQPYTPYATLQSRTTKELSTVLQMAVFAPKPICIVNVNTNKTFFCCGHVEHNQKRLKALKEQLIMIAGTGTEASPKLFTVSITQSTDIDEQIYELLKCISLVHYNEKSIIDVVNQFIRVVSFDAQALIAALKRTLQLKVSWRTKSVAPLTRSDIKQAAAALDLENAARFWSAVKYGDQQLRPGICDLITQALSN